MSIRARWVTALFLAVLSTACDVSKSSNPLSPTISGPIAGVTIGTPGPLAPGQGSQVFMRDQPITVLFRNVTSNGVRPFTYTVEIASDAAFSSLVFKRTGIAPAPGETTSFLLPDPLATGRSYWWRVRAEDGANNSDYSTPQKFDAITPVVLGAPGAQNPQGAINTSTPQFELLSPAESGPVARTVYTVQVSKQSNFAQLDGLFFADEVRPLTVLAPNYRFSDSTTYYWRVQVKDTGDSDAVSPWSATQTFVTPTPAPAPSSGGGGGGGPIGSGNWQACGSTPGYALVDCVRSAVYIQSTEANAFQITKRVAWLLRGQGYGLLIKNGGENIIQWQGYSFSVSRIARPDGGIIKVLSDAGNGGSNGAAWDESLNYPGSVSPSLYVPAINPDLP